MTLSLLGVIFAFPLVIFNNMVKLELELVDIGDVIKMDETGGLLRDLVPNALKESATAERYLEASKPKRHLLCCSSSNEKELLQSDDKLTEQLRTSINRCLRVSDKYLRLLSLLIKSREFHLAYPTACESEKNIPIIELPKTREGKPFIPTPTGRPSDCQFNVSHQHPYLGIAKARGVKVGLDIVTFDEINRKLYQNEREFVNVFQSSFAESEWNSIVGSKSIMHEFFLQWAIKEAYTKALGLGLSLEFNSFVTKLEGVENLWDYVSENADPDKGIVLPATIHHSNNANPERWSFFFLLLKSKDRLIGCACACVPSDEGNSGDRLTVDTRWVEIEELLVWHQQVEGR